MFTLIRLKGRICSAYFSLAAKVCDLLGIIVLKIMIFRAKKRGEKEITVLQIDQETGEEIWNTYSIQ